MSDTESDHGLSKLDRPVVLKLKLLKMLFGVETNVANILRKKHLVEFLNSGLSYLITTVFTISIFLFFQLYARVDHPQPQQ